MARTIYITRDDMQRLQRLVDGLKTSSHLEWNNVTALEEELDRAIVVDAREIRSDVVTLNSQVRIRDLNSGKTMDYEIVYPNTKARGGADPLSVLAPLGTALLGYRAGDLVEWHVPKGKRRLQVIEVLYQPEAARTSAA
jgi:regulator of nucleoside diphosphate kinase